MSSTVVSTHLTEALQVNKLLFAQWVHFTCFLGREKRLFQFGYFGKVRMETGIQHATLLEMNIPGKCVDEELSALMQFIQIRFKLSILEHFL